MSLEIACKTIFFNYFYKFYESLKMIFQKNKSVNLISFSGTKLVNSGYSKWGNQQPDGGDNETCGAMFYNGLLQDLKCDLKCFFICEHDVANLSNVFDDRYGATQ